VQELQQKYGNHPLPAVIVARGCLCLGTEIANSPCSKGKNFMLRGGSLASAGGPRQPAETGIDRAETLGPGGGQRTWKPGPDAAVGPTGAQESTPILFPSAGSLSRTPALPSGYAWSDSHTQRHPQAHQKGTKETWKARSARPWTMMRRRGRSPSCLCGCRSWADLVRLGGAPRAGAAGAGGCA
jgi:hypothetical protein